MALAAAVLWAGWRPPPAAGQQLAVTRVRLDSLQMLGALARVGFEVGGIEEVAGEAYALVVASPSQVAALSAAGWHARPAAPLAAPVAPVHFRDLPRVSDALEGLAARGRITLDTIGLSWEGRPILAAKPGPADDDPGRPNVVFLGAHHAREWISAEMAQRLLEYLADSLIPGAPEGDMTAGRDVWVIPVVNPDGYWYSFETERLWRKNRRANADGTFGVDLNRNYPTFWALDDTGSSGTPEAETYRGPTPASEPETQAMVAFHEAHPPAAAVSYHSFTDLVLYPYGHRAGALTPDDDAFRALAGTPLAPAIGDGLSESIRRVYHPGPGWQLYPTNGEYTEWVYRAFGTLAFTVELTAGCCWNGQSYGFLFPDDSTAIATVVRDNLPFALAVLRAAGENPSAADLFETVWPEVRLVGPSGATSRSVTVRSGTDRRDLTLTADSLDRGAARWRWRGALSMTSAGTRVESGAPGARAQLGYADGAEQETGWTGWSRDSVTAFEGTWYWRSAADTLRSPEIVLAGLQQPRLAFWVRHQGSLFLPDRVATVEGSTDGGATWLPLARIAGAGNRWYPLTVELPGAVRVRLRFVTADLPLDLDAVHVFGTPATPGVVAQEGELAVSENPVRSNRVFFTWEPLAGDARLSVFTFTGALVHRATVAAADGLAAWDLTNSDGAALANGAYVAILELGDRVLRRRLFVARAR